MLKNALHLSPVVALNISPEGQDTGAGVEGGIVETTGISVSVVVEEDFLLLPLLFCSETQISVEGVMVTVEGVLMTKELLFSKQSVVKLALLLKICLSLETRVKVE